MDFSDALKALRSGNARRIQRTGWNGKGMWVCLQDGYPDGIRINANTAKATGFGEGTVMRFRPYLMMYTAQDDCVPWLPSMSDILGQDWRIID
jgi:hypothetical protein